MDYLGKDIIEAIDQVIADSAAAFENGLPAVSVEVGEAVADFLSILAKNRNGTIKASVANLKAIVKFKNHLKLVMELGHFRTLSDNLNLAFSTVTQFINQYFSTISNNFVVADFYMEIRRQNVAATLETLLGSGMESQFIQPITKILQQSVTGQTTSRQALATVKEMLSEAGQPTKWAKTYTDDALNQYARLYTQVISDDLQLENFLYSGTTIDSTRPFCHSKVGKVFTKQQVHAWAKQEWSGKIKGTNAGNIEIYLGGNRCRHRLVPLTQSAADEMKKQS